MKRFKTKSSYGDRYFQYGKFGADLKKDAVKGAGATIISSSCNFFMQTAGVIILARLLKPSDFGLVAMVTSVYAIFQMIRGMGLAEATIQEKEIDHKKISMVFWVNVGFATFLTLIFVLLGPVISWFYGEPRIKLIAMIISLDLFFGGLATQHRALLIKNFHFYKSAAIEIQATFVAFGTAIYLAFHGWGYWAIVSRWVVFSFVEVIGAWTFCRWRPGLPVRTTGIIPMVKFGVNMLGTFIVTYFSRNVDKILIGWRYGSSSLGYYDRAYNLFMAPAQRLSQPIYNVAIVTLSKLRDDPEKFRRYYLNSISKIAFIAFPISAILTVMANDIVLLLLGPQWKKAGPILSAFSVSIGLQMIYYTYSWLHVSLGKSNKLFRWNLIGTSCTILAFLVGLHFGPIGVGICYSASIYILIGPSLWYAGKEIDLSVRSIFLVIWKYFLSAFVTGLVYLYVLRLVVYSSHANIQVNIFTKCFISTLVIGSIYLVTVVIVFQSTKPIKEFISVGLEMVPWGVRK